MIRTSRLALLGLLACLTFPSGRAAETDLLRNGRFDQGLPPWTWDGGPAGDVLAQAGLDGSNVFQLRLDSDQTQNGPATLAQVVSALEPGARYRLTVWVSADRNGESWLQAGARREPLPAGSYDWTLVQLDFTASSTAAPLSVGVTVAAPVARLWLSRFSLIPITGQQDEITRLQAQNHRQLAHLETLLATHPVLGEDAYLRMGLAIARRYVARVDTSGPGHTQGLRNIQPGDPEIARWDLLQARETGTVLARTETRLDALLAPTQAIWRAPSLASRPVTLSGSGFTVSDPDGRPRPIILGGYGHFDAVMEDEAFLRELGVNLVQQERGPRDARPGGGISTHAGKLLRQLDPSSGQGPWIDFLLAPHYLPDDLLARHDDLAGNAGGGFIKYNLDHPAARAAVGNWIDTIVPQAADKPGLFAFCLSNEPSYLGSGRDPWSRPLWTAWLEQKHGTIEALNSAHGTRHAAFADVPVPPVDYPAEPTALPVYYDWVTFNQEHFADWHRWMNDRVKAAAPRALTHAKLIPDLFDTRPQARRTHGGILGRGIDPELITTFTDLAGCDSWSFASRDGDWAYTWVRTHVWYDLLHSFNQRPVIDSELHFIEDRHPAESIPWEQIYATLWLGALHHRTAFVNWLWQEPTGRSSLGSVYLRPANVHAVSQALLDLNRLAPEVGAINAAPARVALLYSPASLFWQVDYPQTVKDLYTLLTVLGHKVTFVSERQLASGRRPEALAALFLPRATHVQDTTPPALDALARSGVALVPVGPDNLAFTAYNQPRIPISARPAPLRIGLNRKADLARLSTLLTTVLGPQNAPEPLLDAATGAPAWGVEYRDLRIDGRRLIPLANLLRTPVHLKFAQGSAATDLISGQPVDLADFHLQPMQTLLVEPTPASSQP